MQTAVSTARPLTTRPMTFWNAAWQPRSYLNLAYLFVAFPLGIIYFVALSTGLSVGLGTVIVWVGVPILGAVGLMAWGMAALERGMTIHWLGFDVPPMLAAPLPTDTKFWPRVWAHLQNPTTWKSLVYLMIKFPFGIMSFTLAITLTSLSLALTLQPLAYLVATSLYHAYGWTDPSNTFSIFTGEVIPINGQFDWGGFLKLLAETPLGLLLGLLSLHISNGVAWLWGRFAQVMLGTPPVA